MRLRLLCSTEDALNNISLGSVLNRRLLATPYGKFEPGKSIVVLYKAVLSGCFCIGFECIGGFRSSYWWWGRITEPQRPRTDQPIPWDQTLFLKSLRRSRHIERPSRKSLSDTNRFASFRLGFASSTNIFPSSISSYQAILSSMNSEMYHLA